MEWLGTIKSKAIRHEDSAEEAEAIKIINDHGRTGHNTAQSTQLMMMAGIRERRVPATL